jgi:hypothetical protein
MKAKTHKLRVTYLQKQETLQYGKKIVVCMIKSLAKEKMNEPE